MDDQQRWQGGGRVAADEGQCDAEFLKCELGPRTSKGKCHIDVAEEERYTQQGPGIADSRVGCLSETKQCDVRNGESRECYSKAEPCIQIPPWTCTRCTYAKTFPQEDAPFRMVSQQHSSLTFAPRR